MDMRRYNAMSPIGYLIVVVVLLAFCMIISAPFLLEDSKENSAKDVNPEFLRGREYTASNSNNSGLEQRVNDLENQINLIKNASSDKYVCVIEGKLDDNGNVVSVDKVTNNKKFVFVCEYRY